MRKERRLAPPSGTPAPASGLLPGGGELQLVPLAEEICRRYRAEFPDEAQRYGDAGVAWCVHDNQHLLNWALLGLRGHADLLGEVSWLARVLEARRFPLGRLARNLDIGADVVLERVTETVTDDLARSLREAAAHIRSRATFLD